MGFEKQFQKSISLLQSNKITESYYRVSLLEKELMWALQVEMQKQVQVSHLQKVRISEFLKRKTSRVNNSDVERAAKRLVRRNIMVFSSLEGKYVGFRIVNSVEVEKGTMYFELDKRLMPLLVEQTKNFTAINLGVAFSLESVNTKRIYEMLCQYQDTGVLYIAIQELKLRLGLLTVDGQGRCQKEKYKDFSVFKKFVLERAEKELEHNEAADLSFRYETHKKGKGKKYTHLTFLISRKKRYKKRGLLGEKDESEVLVNVLKEKFGLSSFQAKKIVENVPTDEINKTKYDIELLRINNKIGNIGAYTAKVFDKKYELGFFSSKTNY